MALEKGTEEFMMMGDFFNIMKKFWKVQNEDSYWDNLRVTGNEFVKKYKDIPFAKGLMLALLDEQERKAEKIK